VNNGARVSVIIATMSRPAELALTVTSAMAGTTAPGEVVVVDASADDRTELLVTHLAAAFKRVRFVCERTAPSLPRQRNAGLDAATGEFVLFLDDDVTLEPAFLEALLKAFEEENVGGACGLITNQVLPSRYVSFLQWLFRQVRYARRSLLQRSGLPTFLYQPREAAEVKILTGCNMAFRREAVVRFDERINYFDDDDVSLMVARRWRLVQVPAEVRRRVLEQRLLHRRHLPQNFWNVACYYYGVWGAAAAAALRLKPRLFLGTILGLWDVHKTRGGLRVDAAFEEKLTPKPQR